MSETSITSDHEEPEVIGQVVDWRLGVLLDAGYGAELAWQIAVSDADLHVAVGLVQHGCAPRLAARILL